MKSLLWVWVCLGLLLGGCGTLTRLPPPSAVPVHELTVFSDAFHSGVVVRAAACDPALDQAQGFLAAWPWLTIHSGERKWMLDPEAGMLHAAGLGFSRHPALLQMDRHTNLDQAWGYIGVDRATLRLWHFQVSEAGWAAWQRHVREAWIAGPHLPRPPGDPTTYWPCQHDWWLDSNCHDFTLAMLRAAGLPLRQRWIYSARQVHLDLTRAQEALTAAGITVLDPGTNP